VGDTSRFASVREAYATAQLWADEHGLVLLRPTPFSDTDGLAATAVYAGAHHLRSLEDLRRLGSTVTLGAPIEFEQDPSGLAQLEQAYGFKPAATRPIDIGSQYEQLRAGLLQATWVTTTDGQLATPEFVVLRDTRHVFGFGNVIPVVPKSVVTSEGPAFVQTIDQVDALLSPEVMRELNAQATLEAQDPATIAHDFLVEHGVLPPSGTA
jgi:glycine betaine/choline ABC-type transport system substrate-binding protein